MHNMYIVTYVINTDKQRKLNLHNLEPLKFLCGKQKRNQDVFRKPQPPMSIYHDFLNPAFINMTHKHYFLYSLLFSSFFMNENFATLWKIFFQRWHSWFPSVKFNLSILLKLLLFHTDPKNPIFVLKKRYVQKILTFPRGYVFLAWRPLFGYGKYRSLCGNQCLNIQQVINNKLRLCLHQK